jgi:hypothetical protein
MVNVDIHIGKKLWFARKETYLSNPILLKVRIIEVRYHTTKTTKISPIIKGLFNREKEESTWKEIICDYPLLQPTEEELFTKQNKAKEYLK